MFIVCVVWGVSVSLFRIDNETYTEAQLATGSAVQVYSNWSIEHMYSSTVERSKVHAILGSKTPAPFLVLVYPRFALKLSHDPNNSLKLIEK